MTFYGWTFVPLEHCFGEDGDSDPLLCGAMQRLDCERRRRKECIFSEGDYLKCRPLVLIMEECSKQDKSGAAKTLQKSRTQK